MFLLPQLLKQPCTVVKFPSMKQKQNDYEYWSYSIYPAVFVFWPTVMMNINKLILYYQQEKLINNVSPGNLLVFLCETKFYLLCFLSHFKSFSFLYIQSRGQERALALAIQKLTTAISPGSLAWCLACS